MGVGFSNSDTASSISPSINNCEINCDKNEHRNRPAGDNDSEMVDVSSVEGSFPGANSEADDRRRFDYKSNIPEKERNSVIPPRKASNRGNYGSVFRRVCCKVICPGSTSLSLDNARTKKTESRAKCFDDTESMSHDDTTSGDDKSDSENRAIHSDDQRSINCDTDENEDIDQCTMNLPASPTANNSNQLQ